MSELSMRQEDEADVDWGRGKMKDYVRHWGNDGLRSSTYFARIRATQGEAPASLTRGRGHAWSV